MLYAIPQCADRDAARARANEVASLLGVKAKSDRQIVIGEPECHYGIRINTASLWFGVRFSDRQFVVKGTHKRAGEVPVPFHASLNKPYPVMLTRVPLEVVSKDLGIQVFVADPLVGPATSTALRAAPVRTVLAQMDFVATSLAFISPAQLYTLNGFTGAEQVAAQILLQRDLLEALSTYLVPPNKLLERTRGR